MGQFFFIDLSSSGHKLVLQSDLHPLHCFNWLEWPKSLAARQDVVFELFADEFVDFSLSFHMERCRKCNKVLIHYLERVGPCILTDTPDIV